MTSTPRPSDVPRFDATFIEIETMQVPTLDLLHRPVWPGLH